MPLTSTGRPSLLATSGSSGSVGYPEAFYAHNHKTPERSNRQKKHVTSTGGPMMPNDDSNNGRPSSNQNNPPGARPVGRLRPQQLNLFTKAGGSTTSTTTSNTSSANLGGRKSPDNSSNNNNNGKGNVGNGFSHIQQQLMRQQQPQQPPAAHFHDSNRSVASSTTASTAYASTATLAATIPSSHVNIITQAYGTKADIYEDILKIPRDMRSEREIRIAYFRRGRQVLAERPDPGATTANTPHHKVNSNVSQLAKMRFQAVSMAYEILSNPVWKESYDKHGLFGPDAFQEPAGSASMLAEDASLADPQVLAQQSQDSHSPTGGDNSTHSNFNGSGLEVVDNSRIAPAHSLDNNDKSQSYSQKPQRRNNTVDMNGMQVVASENNMNGDNVSCVSQSTAGTTSTGGYTGAGVLRKTGSFLDKLNKHKANIRKQTQLQQRHSPTNQFNNNGHYQHQDSSDYPPPVQPSATVRWNEEVEELIFRQDPDEISFKAGTSTFPMETDAEQKSDQPSHNPRTLEQQQEPPQQQPQPQQEQYDDEPNHDENQQTYEEPHQQKAQTSPDAEQDYHPHAGANRLQRQDSYPNGAVGSPQSAQRPRGRDANGKQRVVLDTAELGSHLEKLDKVADSIADIFDELEASFDGLLGGFAPPKVGPQAVGVTSRPLLEPPTPAALDEHHQMHSEEQQQQPSPGQALAGDNAIAIGTGTPSVTEHEDQPPPAEAQYDEASYHTPPISIGSTSRRSAVEQQHDDTSELLANEQAMTRLEALQVEEQAMALLREISACESVPPPDVVVKTKKSKHESHHSLPGDMATLVEATQEISPPNGPQTNHHLLRFDGVETYSACASDMAAGGENTTVATTSVVSLLDAEKHSNAPLKPAATTSTTGAKASRKRLKNVQRRRQQQRAREQQQEQEEAYANGDTTQRWDPSPATQENVGLSVRDSTTKWNQLANPSAEASQKPKKPPKKKNTEDQYFESLYQNFFALPKERLPNEMTVRTKPNRSSCSVSTLSQSVATTQEPTVKLEFDPWGLGSSAWPKLGDANDEKERRSKHHKDVMARVDEMLVQRNTTSAMDMTFDSSFPDDTSFDSATAVDTSFGDSTAMDTAAHTAFTSALDHRKSGNIAAAAITGCEGGAPAVFLNNVFNVPLEAPLDYFCGEAKDCASSTKPGKKRLVANPKQKPEKNQKPTKSAAKAQDPSGDVSSQEESTEHLEDDGPPTDESITLLDPPTHDSRIRMSRSDDSTLNTLNTNNAEEPAGFRETRPMDPSTSPSPSEGSRSREMTTVGSDTEDVDDARMKNEELDDECAQSPVELVKVETASYSQFFDDGSSSNDASGELDEIETGSVTDPATGSEGEEERDGNAPDDRDVQRFTPEIDSEPSNQVPEASDSGSTMEAIPAPSSLSGKRIEIDSEVPSEDQAIDDDDGESCAASVASTAVSSSQGKKPSNLITYLMTYLKKATAENPSLSCMKANIDSGLESWRASNNACMDAIVISDEDMSGMLDILQKEMMWPPETPKSSE